MIRAALLPLLLVAPTDVSAPVFTASGGGIELVGTIQLSPAPTGAAAPAPPAACYANCDGSGAPPVLNAADFACFLRRFQSDDPWANCDGSTLPPLLSVADLTCFLQRFTAGCP